MEMLRAEPWCYYPLTLQFLSSQHSALRGRCPPPPPHVAVLVAPLDALPEGGEQAEEAEPLGCSSERDDSGSSDGEDAGAGPQHPPLDGRQAAQPADSASVLAAAGDDAAAPKGGKGSRAAAQAAVACKLCSQAATRTWIACAACGTRTHVECLARHFLHPAGSSGSSGGAEAEAPLALPARGSCPGCGAQQTWMDALRSAQNAGWDKGRKRGGGQRGGKRADGTDVASAASQQQQQQQQGSPAQSTAAGKPGLTRKPRSRKAAPEAAAQAEPRAEAGGAAPAAGSSPSKRKPRARKLKPLLEAGSSSDPSSSSSHWEQAQGQEAPPSFAAEAVLEALPWEDFSLASPLQAQLRRQQDAQHQQQQAQQRGGPEVVHVSDSEEDSLVVPLGERLRQQYRMQPPQPEQQLEDTGQDAQRADSGQAGATSPPPRGAAAGAAASDAIDLVSPSPLPLLQRLRKQRLVGGRDSSPRATPSPAPQRKLRRRSPKEGAAAGAPVATAAAAAAAANHPGRQPALELAMDQEVVVISDSD